MPQTSQLFDGITPEEYTQMMTCFHATEKNYRAEETICSYDTTARRIGCLLEGEAAIVRTYYDGRQSILEYLKTGDVFGSALSAVSAESSALDIICKKNCRIQFINYEHLIKRCSNACSFHSQLVNNALQLISRKAVSLSERLEVLSQRSIRDKLLCYFMQQTQGLDTATFLLPFSFSSLADYLSVDRSAMMREMKKLKEEGLISVNKKQITLTE